MPILPPLLDDRTWKDIRDEAIARAPIYTQEWTDFRPGDPGVALVELFAYMTEALIYRLNRVPDNSYLAFLNLLDMPPISGEPARGIVQLAGPREIAAVTVPKATKLKGGGAPFTTVDSLSALPIELHTFIKEGVPPPSDPDLKAYADAAWQEYVSRTGPKEGGKLKPINVKTSIYPPVDGQVTPIQQAADGALWIAVAMRKNDFDVKKPERAAELRRALGEQVLSIGMAPVDLSGPRCTYCAQPADGGGNRAQAGGMNRAEAAAAQSSVFRWEITAPQGTAGAGLLQQPVLDLNGDGLPRYQHVALLSDSTSGLRRPGAIKLQLPPADTLYTWKQVKVGSKTVPISYFPVAGDFPPVLDDGELENRVLFWLRALPATAGSEAIHLRPKLTVALSFVGPNVVDVLQSSRQEREAIGTGNGQAGQQFSLAKKPVIAGTMQLQVQEGNATVDWREVSSFDAASERDSVYMLDRALGVISVGDGLQGRVLPVGAAVIASYEYGGGLAGNLPAGALSTLEEKPTGLDSKVSNPVPTAGGSETETVEQARRRVPVRLRHQERAVTAEDFRELTLLTPGVSVGRAEVLPLYNPRDGKTAPGVVTVLVIPTEDPAHPRAPLPDANMRALVCAHLDKHRLITTELYVIGPTYRRIAVYAGVAVKSNFGIEDVRKWVRLALYQFLSPLAPFGPDGAGWPLGGRINRGAIEAAILQVNGVSYVEELRFYSIDENGKYQLIEKPKTTSPTPRTTTTTTTTTTTGPMPGTTTTTTTTTATTTMDGPPRKVGDWLDLGPTELPELVDVQIAELAAPPPPQDPLQSNDGVAVPVPLPRSKC